ncbi:MAG: hypothetical protein JNK65_09075 [Deltaproteobacteria bacterium]|nr:hypothetical protein [Deltaproteobacteria bacterium]
MNKIPDPSKMKKIKGPQINAKTFKNSKIRVFFDMDTDTLETLQKLAAKTHKTYQTLLNQILKQYLSQKAA